MANLFQKIENFSDSYCLVFSSYTASLSSVTVCWMKVVTVPM